VVRLATEVRLTVELDPTVPESIRRPLLELYYQETLTSTITSDTTVSCQYFNDYYQGVSKLWKAMKVIFIVMNFVCLAIIAVRLYFFYQHNPVALLGTKFAG
jgi:hypothetical protein